jgi:hypothetical protein
MLLGLIIAYYRPIDWMRDTPQPGGDASAPPQIPTAVQPVPGADVVVTPTAPPPVAPSETVDVPQDRTVVGRIVSRDGVAYPGHVQLLGMTDSTIISTGRTDDSLQFHLSHVPAGPARLQAWTFAGDEELPSRGETLVTIASSGVTTADALIPRGTLTAGQRDSWEVTAAAGDPVNIYIWGTRNGTAAALADPVIDVLNPDGTTVILFSPGVAFTAPTAGRYSIVVQSHSGVTGGYRLMDLHSHFFGIYSGDTVSGRVTREGDGVSLPSLTVRVTPIGHAAVTTSTGPDGQYATGRAVASRGAR